MSINNTAKELAAFFKARDPNERYDTIIVQKGGRTVFQFFEREDADRILELIEMTPLK